MNDNDKSFRAFMFQTPFGAMFALAFLYMGCLGFALDGYPTAARVCGWLGFGLLCYCAILSTVGLVREYRAATSTDES